LTDPVHQGDELESWLSEQRGDLVRLARSILRDPEEAEDVVQETLLAVLRQKRPIRRLGAYAARAVYWNALKQRARRRAHVSLEAVPEAALPRAGRAGDEYLDPFELERAIAGLPPAQQTVIRLRFYLGLSFAEIASNLSISVNTAASRSRYALAKLRRALRPAAGQTGEGARS
jgi:RNA polymerase sigma-70 factor (ECF subfamily)